MTVCLNRLNRLGQLRNFAAGGINDHAGVLLRRPVIRSQIGNEVVVCHRISSLHRVKGLGNLDCFLDRDILNVGRLNRCHFNRRRYCRLDKFNLASRFQQTI